MRLAAAPVSGGKDWVKIMSFFIVMYSGGSPVHTTHRKASGQLCRHLLYSKAFFHPSTSRLYQALSQFGILDQSLDSVGQGQRVSGRYQQSVVHAFKQLRYTARHRGDYRDSTTHGLDDRD